MSVNADLFWSYVNKSGSCWLWLADSDKGYGKYGGHLAHRVAYELVVDLIPDGLELDHLCRKTLCVNPSHLEPVTRLENMRRRYAIQTHCAHGHEFTPENTYTRLGAGEGRRQCRKCNLAAVRRYKNRAAA